MAIKDWKKSHNLKDMKRWQNANTWRDISIYKFKDWEVRDSRSEDDAPEITLSKHKTLSQALKFAKSYMRKH